MLKGHFQSIVPSAANRSNDLTTSPASLYSMHLCQRPCSPDDYIPQHMWHDHLGFSPGSNCWDISHIWRHHYIFHHSPIYIYIYNLLVKRSFPNFCTACCDVANHLDWPLSTYFRILREGKEGTKTNGLTWVADTRIAHRFTFDTIWMLIVIRRVCSTHPPLDKMTTISKTIF